MKRKRIFSIVLCCVIIITLCDRYTIWGEASELFEVTGIARRFYYNQYLSDGRLNLSCYDYNVSTKTSESSWKGVRWYNHLTLGQQYWNSAKVMAGGYPPNHYVSCTTESSNKAHVWYAVPLDASWKEIIGDDDIYGTFALTVVSDMNGNEIKRSTCLQTGNLIRSANIYFNPILMSGNVNAVNNTSNAGNCTVAHELGHVLGFGHLAEGVSTLDSIMKQGIKSFSSLQEYDMAQLRVKYGK